MVTREMHGSEVKVGSTKVPSTQYNEEAESGIRSLRRKRSLTLGETLRGLGGTGRWQEAPLFVYT